MFVEQGYLDKPKVEPKPNTLEHLVSWLEKFPANQSFNYHDPSRCLAAQYKGSIDLGYSPVITPLGEEPKTFDQKLEMCAVKAYRAPDKLPSAEVYTSRTHHGTFGNALLWAKKMLAEEQEGR